MAHPEVAEAEAAQGRLGPFDPAQHLEVHLGAVGHPGREAWRRRLVPGAQPQLPRGGADVGLGEAGGHERELGATLGRGLLAGSVLAEVVEVDAEGDAGAEVGGDRLERVHQRVLAPEAAVAVVGAVGRRLHLVGLDLQVPEPDLRREVGGVLALGRRQRRRHGRDRHHAVAQDLVGHGGEERRVGAARVRDHRRAPRLHDPPQHVQVGPTRRHGVDDLEADALVALALGLGLDHADAADLAGRAHVGAAVGLLVEPDDVDHADLGHRLGDEVHLGADEVLVLHGVGPGQERHLDGSVGGELGVHQLLDSRPEALGQRVELEVHAGGERLHVPAGHRHPPLVPDHAAQHVQRGVGAHQAVAAVPVDAAVDGSPTAGSGSSPSSECHTSSPSLRTSTTGRPASVPVSWGWPPPVG